jgi:uncharacterized membrane protein YgdD (TMEM256/DUF423 family)
MNIIRSLSALFMAIGVGCGAFGAHVLRANLPPERIPKDLAIWDTAVQYNLVHALAALVFLSLSDRFISTRAGRTIGLIMLLSTSIFSGSLYLLVLTNTRWLGAITPIGGIGFILGWCYAALKFSRQR